MNLMNPIERIADKLNNYARDELTDEENYLLKYDKKVRQGVTRFILRDKKVKVLYLKTWTVGSLIRDARLAYDKGISILEIYEIDDDNPYDIRHKDVFRGFIDLYEKDFESRLNEALTKYGWSISKTSTICACVAQIVSLS